MLSCLPSSSWNHPLCFLFRFAALLFTSHHISSCKNVTYFMSFLQNLFLYWINSLICSFFPSVFYFFSFSNWVRHQASIMYANRLFASPSWISTLPLSTLWISSFTFSIVVTPMNPFYSSYLPTTLISLIFNLNLLITRQPPAIPLMTSHPIISH